MFKKILVPLDGSELSENALNVAMRLAQSDDCVIYLVRAVQQELQLTAGFAGEPMMSPSRPLSDIVDGATEYLSNFQNRNAGSDVLFQNEVAFSDPAELILDTAKTKDVDIIVMSTHGRSGVQRWLYGSVTEKVLRHADCPVLAVRSAEIPQRILVTLDGSPLSESILPSAVELAEAFYAKIVLAHVQDQGEAPPWGDLRGIGLETDGLAEMMEVGFYRRGETYLQEVAQRYNKYDVEFDVAYGGGNPADYILNLAENDNCDMIAMSTHGRSGLSRFRFGSVTEKVLRHNNRAMFIVRQTAD